MQVRARRAPCRAHRANRLVLQHAITHVHVDARQVQEVAADAMSVIQHHGAGWPLDLLQQLAVALDVPLSAVSVPVRVGGPFFLAAATGLTPYQARQFLR